MCRTDIKICISMILECVKKYLEDDGLNHPEFSKTIMDEFPDEPAYRKCKATLNSSMKLESLVGCYTFICKFSFSPGLENASFTN